MVSEGGMQILLYAAGHNTETKANVRYLLLNYLTNII